ncbi:MAG: hypothetical protein ABI588_09250, partial [Arenimonas sp.]
MSALAVVLVLLATCVAYWPGLDGGYVFDDLPNIVNNPDVQVSTERWQDWLGAAFSSPSSRLQRPLAMLSFAANHYFTGLDPRPMKLTNIGLHLLNFLLVLGMLRCLLRVASAATGGRNEDKDRDGIATLFAGAAWALHPINLMAVLFIVQRMESLSHTFVFAGLWLYLAGRGRQLAGLAGWSRVLAGLAGGTLLGVLVKESAVLLPLYAFLVEFCVLGFRAQGSSTGRRLRLLYLLVLALPAALAIAWLGSSALAPGAFGSRDFNVWERLLTEFRVVLDYLRWSVLPDLGSMSLYHDDYQVSRGLLSPPSTLFAMVAMGVTCALAIGLRRRRPLTALGLSWFLSAQLLTATVIPLELMFEHRN